MSLQLLYHFTSSPKQIIASGEGNAPLNVVNLQVMITNPTTSAIQLTSIAITIPCGGQPGDDANMLSDNPDLPSPDYDTSSGWSGSTSGDTVTLDLPTAGITDSASFIFNLSGIQVDRAPGSVQITIVEDGPPKVVDNTTYSLAKQPNTAPITSFYAQPATLNNVNEPVKLFWDCTAAGSNYAYCVYSDSWNTQQPDACINSGTCNSCADGASNQGIQTGPLMETTTFYLDVIQKNDDGSRTVYQTNQTKVQVLLPKFSSDTHAETYLSGRVMLLHWLVFNAAYCTVELDGETVIVSNAPVDTLDNGYLIVLTTTEAGLHQVTVTAYAGTAPGSAQHTHPFPDVNIDPFVTIKTDATASQFIAITPDGTKALLPGENLISLVDIASSTVTATLKMDGGPAGVAITPDGTRAFLGINGTPDQVMVIDLPGMTIAKSILFNTPPIDYLPPNDLAITPDGTLALVCGEGVIVIDISTLTVEAKTIPVNGGPERIAITPDGTLALTTNTTTNTSSVAMIDIASRSTVTNFAAGNSTMSIAITPDGEFALVANVEQNTVALIDIAKKSVAATIPVGKFPGGIAMLDIPNYGALALVANYQDSTISFIDISNQVALPAVLNVGFEPYGIAVLPDGSHILVTSTTYLTQI